MITHIHKLLATEQSNKSFLLQIIQASNLPTSIPHRCGIRADLENYVFWWQWVPGEETYELEINFSCPTRATINMLLMRLKATKPWRLDDPEDRTN